jgi:hypothetical protein
MRKRNILIIKVITKQKKGRKNMKTLIQRNLPITQKYVLIGSFYSPMENGCSCNNCGRLISSVAEVRGTNDNTRYIVGMDCAETLSGIKDDYFNWEYNHKANFNTAKQIRTALLKWTKKAKSIGDKYEVTASTFPNKHGVMMGGIDYCPENISKAGRYWRYEPLEIWDKYIKPMITDLITEYK